MAAKSVDFLLSETLVEIGFVRILWGALFPLAVCSLIVFRFWRRKSPKTLLISRIGKDPNQVGLGAARRDFMLDGHSLIKEGYMDVCSISISSQCFLHRPIRATVHNTRVGTVVDGSV